MKPRQILVIIIAILLLTNLFLGVEYFSAQNESKNIAAAEREKTKFREFNKTFIAEVLQAENEVNYDTRLKLENMVKDMNDNELKDQWLKFTQSQTEQEAQKEAGNLLELLARKME